MKHKIEYSGLYEKRYCEAQCTLCLKQFSSGADFMDTSKIESFWKKIWSLNDCTGKKKRKTKNE